MKLNEITNKSQIMSQQCHRIWSQVMDQVVEQIHRQLYGEFCDQCDNRIDYRVKDRVRIQLWSEPKIQVYDQVIILELTNETI
jgi:hypothetical protein